MMNSEEALLECSAECARIVLLVEGDQATEESK